MKLKITVESLPLHFVVLGVFLIIFGLANVAAAQSIILNSILLLVGILLATSHQEITINTNRKTFSEYYWVLGMKMSNYTEDYSEITAITATTGNYSQEYGKYNRRFISGTIYKAHIELLDQEAIFIGQNKSKAALLKRIAKISDKLGVPTKDQTDN